ncbi:MAG: hypothetical protein AB1490_18760 [Pseudomonadota bacterium]
MIRPSGILLGILLTAVSVQAASAADCNADAAKLRRAETELPKLEVAPPNDRQIVCITLETNVLFARRLAAHVQQCPRSPYAKSAETWAKTGSNYAAQFSSKGCKPAIKPYRG